VCNAAILADRNAKPTELSEATFQRVLAVNLTGTFLCAQTAARQMRERGQGGKVVTVGSRASRRGMADLIAYSASKFGVIGLTQNLALALAPYGIRVDCVCPGAVDTDMSTLNHEERAQQLHVSFDEAKSDAGREISLGCLTTADDVAEAIVWLASSETDHIAGQALNLNGGSLMN
jgi:NAD(P)-dependent dehydrogenase (short-subunit alcohol dehydrogenase family)